MTPPAFTVHGRRDARPLAPVPCNLVIAGWTGRDRAAVERHIEELAALGVPRPAAVPVFYRVAADLLTTAPAIQVAGTGSTGEVECVLIADAQGLHVGVGSDHTDRQLERHSVAWSKQVCHKPVGPALWPLADVEDHWDALILRSHARIRGQRMLYQEGAVAALRTPMELSAAYSGGAPMAAGTAMFCGTLPARVEIEFADRFELELHDPVLGRSLHHSYAITALPVA